MDLMKLARRHRQQGSLETAAYFGDEPVRRRRKQFRDAKCYDAQLPAAG